MKCKMLVKLVPFPYQSTVTGKTHVEQVLVYLDGYASSLIHIDTFFSGRELYDKLRAGVTVEGTLTISAPDPDEEDEYGK
jgi:hypothetical protein